MANKQIFSQEQAALIQEAQKYIDACTHGTPGGVLPDHEILDETLLAQCLDTIAKARDLMLRVYREDGENHFNDLFEQTTQAAIIFINAGFQTIQATQEAILGLGGMFDMSTINIELDPLTGMK